MDKFQIHDLRELMAADTEPCVSIYLPTAVTGPDAKQDLVRLKNLANKAEELTASQWLRAPNARDLLQKVRDLSADPAFWDERKHGFAVFVSPDSFHSFRLDTAFDEIVVVNRRFYVRPLFRVLAGQDRYFVLALSQNNVRFLQGSRNLIEQVDVAGLPTNMKDALNYSEADRGTQVHSAMHGSTGKQAAVFHGHGGQSETRKEDLAAFFRQVDSGLKAVLREQTAPLLLAGVDYVVSIYREVNHNAKLLDQQMEGNCDRLTPHELGQRAWPLVEPTVEQKRLDAVHRYVEMAGSSKTSEDIGQILPAALEGRIETLFVDEKANQWGTYDAETNNMYLHDESLPGDDELFDLAAVQTLSKGGTVYSVPRDQIPNQQALAAMFRY